MRPRRDPETDGRRLHDAFSADAGVLGRDAIVAARSWSRSLARAWRRIAPSKRGNVGPTQSAPGPDMEPERSCGMVRVDGLGVISQDKVTFNLQRNGLISRANFCNSRIRGSYRVAA